MGMPVGEIMGGLLGIGLLVLVLRWGSGNGASLPVPRPPDPDDTTGDGLLEEVSRVRSESDAQQLRSRLRGAGIRATIGRVDGCYRLLVFPADLVDARVVLSRGARE